jgi:hypothetical protein
MFLFTSINENWGEPLQWHGYLGLFTYPLVIPAVYGLCVTGLEGKVLKDVHAGRGFFIGAAIVGVVFSALGYMLNRLGHLGCGDSCVPLLVRFFRWPKVL